MQSRFLRCPIRTSTSLSTVMTINVLDHLASLLEQEGDSLLARWREQVRGLPSAKDLDTPTLNDHIPSLLVELVEALRAHADDTIAESLIEGSPPAHGLQRVEDGFDITEVVAEYNMLRDCIHDLADQHDLNLRGKPFRIVNRVLDNAIALAVQSFATYRAEEVKRKREEYLTFVAHDLRTPLNAVSLAASVLEIVLPAQNSSVEVSQMLQSLKRNTRQLDALITKILDENANLETKNGVKLERRLFDLWPLAESLIHDLKLIAGNGRINLINAVPYDLVVFADASAIRRVLQNLISNAIRYAADGTIEIGARYVSHCVAENLNSSQATSPQDGLTLAGPESECLNVECWVSDDGDGISEDLLERVFDTGETAPDGTGGMGFGLAIVKTFVEAHGGVVSVASARGKGSTFRFTLPQGPNRG